MLDDYAALVAADRVTVAAVAGTDAGVGGSEVAAGSELIAGLIVGWPVEEHWFIDNIAVDPSQQGAGVGGRLLLHVEQVARAAGLDELRLYTNEVMGQNIAYYERRGFEITHRAIEHGYRRIWFSRQL